jgi:hypothetical protein
MKRLIFSKGLLLGLLLTTRVFGFLNQNNDFQLWVMADVRKSISPCLEFEFQSEYRFGNDASELFLYYFQAQMVYSPKEWLAIAPGYRQQETKLLGEWFSSYAPLADVSFTFCLGKTKVVDRSRFQYFINEGRSDVWVYRHRDAFFFRPVGEIHPYLFEEIFFAEARGFVQNRLEVGAYVPLRGKGRLFGGYLLRHQKFESEWRAAHILHFMLLVAF